MVEGWDAYFTTAIPFDVQGSRLGLILKEKVKDQRSNLQYVDLRYNEKVFFRMRDLPAPTTGTGSGVGDKPKSTK
jgi:hypothetical protein